MVDQLLDDLFAAIQRGDIDAVAGFYADDVEVHALEPRDGPGQQCAPMRTARVRIAR